MKLFHNSSNLLALTVGAAIALGATSAAAATVSATINYDTLGLQNTSWLVPATVTASNTSSVSVSANDLPPIPYYGYDLYHTTYMGATASSNVWGTLSSDTHLAAGGRIDAISTWSDSFTNLSGGAQAYGFNFAIDSVWFTMGGWSANYDTRDYRAGYSASVLVNGNAVWTSTQTLSLNDSGIHLEKSGYDLGTGALDDYSWSEPNYAYNLNQGTGILASGPVNLGTFANGETFSVTYTLSSFAYWNDPDGCSYECGWVSAGVSDPFGVSISPMIVPNPVPEPETYAMLLAGLGLMAGVARRRKAAAQ